MKKKQFVKLITICIVAIIAASTAPIVFGAEHTPGNLMQRLGEEGMFAKAILEMPKAYDNTEKVQQLMDHFAGLIMMVQLPAFQSGKLDAATFSASLDKLAELRKSIKQVSDPETFKIYLWPKGKKPVIVPYTNDPVGMFWDKPGFEPYIVPYLLEGSVKPRGAIIICPGGGYFVRSEPSEGDAYAKYFNSIGYQAFVLHYRVAPSSPIESSLDLQRAVRYVRYNAKKYGISSDKIVTIGSSAGGTVCINEANEMYGNIQPGKFAKEYVSDNIDKISADVSAFIGIYTGFISDKAVTNKDLKIINPAFPSTFLAYGNKDVFINDWNKFSSIIMNSKIPFELHIFEGSPHGFGLGYNTVTGAAYEGTNKWPELAAIWLGKALSMKEK